MKLLLMPKEPTWWIWLLTLVFLVVGASGQEVGFAVAISLSAGQIGYFWAVGRSIKAFPVQIRIAYTVLLALCFLPFMRWLYWLPIIGTAALLLFGYCLTARLLSLLPWNRSEPLSLDLVRRTFFTPPLLGNSQHGLPRLKTGLSVCSLEAQVGRPPLREAQHADSH